MIYNKFSDFAKEHIPIDGDKLKIIDVIGKEILITDYNIKSSKYNHNPCLTIQFVLDNKKYIVFTGSNVISLINIKIKSLSWQLSRK